jgi:CHAD domain-containing protein
MAKPPSICWDPSESAAENARRVLPSLLRAYFLHGRECLRTESSPEALHALRLETKRLRHTLELFRACYGPGLQRYLDALRQMQQHLGAINDHVVTVRFVARESESAGRRKIDQFVARRIRRETARLHRYWRESFDIEGAERRWLNYLERSR